MVERDHFSVTKLQVSNRLAAPVWAGKSSFVLRLRLFAFLIAAEAASAKHESAIEGLEREAALAILKHPDLHICGFSMDVGQTHGI